MILRQSIAFSCLFFIITALYEGDDCTLKQSGRKGKCISVAQCEYAKTLLQSQRRPEICGFNIHLPLVCCPTKPEGNRTTFKSNEKCDRYYDKYYQIYAAASGELALPKEFPHMVAVGYGDKSSIIWLCGGTLISTEFVLTAAHCVHSEDFGVVKWIRLGDLDLENKTEDANPQDFSVTRFFVHPDYKPPSHYHDIALLQFNEPIAFNIFYKPACLNRLEILPGQALQAIGWGQTGFIEDRSSHLMKVNLVVIEHQKCQEYFSKTSKRRLPYGILDQFQICAGDDTGKGRDTCPGDSGGPLHYYTTGGNPRVINHFVVAGITSFGKGCGLSITAGVYTRVSAYADWIEDIVWS